MSVTNFADERTLSEATLTCLADERRRTILRTLRRQDAPVDRRTLAERVAVAEHEYSQPAIESVEVTLHHVHLPKLEAAGLVTYDEVRDQIALDSLDETAEIVLDDA